MLPLTVRCFVLTISPDTDPEQGRSRVHKLHIVYVPLVCNQLMRVGGRLSLPPLLIKCLDSGSGTWLWIGPWTRNWTCNHIILQDDAILVWTSIVRRIMWGGSSRWRLVGWSTIPNSMHCSGNASYQLQTEPCGLTEYHRLELIGICTYHPRW